MTTAKFKRTPIKAIITVGFCPCWDITCRVDGIEWGEHKKIASKTSVPAGKAMNISKALNWLGVQSTAAGLWGQSDYGEMAGVLQAGYPFIRPDFTIVSGKTRQNITLIDTKSSREMHLRAECQLAEKSSLRQLKKDLDRIVTPASSLVFAGSMPFSHLEDSLAIIKRYCDNGAKVAVDTSGQSLVQVVAAGGLYLVKPNLEELSYLLGRTVRNQTHSIIKAARLLCDKVSIVLVSRGRDGAIAVMRDHAIVCRAKQTIKAVNTVGCGDYLLAGFLSQIHTGNMQRAISAGVQVATARACGLSETATWSAAVRKIKVESYPS